MRRAVKRGAGPCAGAAEGCGKGNRAGGRCLSPSLAAAEAPAEQPAVADTPRRRQHRGARGLSDRDKFLMRPGSAFLKAELLTLAAKDLMGREVHLVCPQEGGELRVAVLC